MKKFLYIIIIASLHLTTQAKNQNPFYNTDPAYTNVITKRSQKITDQLNLEDSSVYNRVNQILVEQYRNVSAIHDFKDDQLKKIKNLEGIEKELRKKAINDSALAQLYFRHAHFISLLQANINHEKIEIVKNGITNGIFQHTLNGFLSMLPQLTQEEKRYIYTALYEARELAMDQGSSKSKHAVFGKYKGRINNYLSKRGYDLAKESKAWEERLRQQKNNE